MEPKGISDEIEEIVALDLNKHRILTSLAKTIENRIASAFKVLQNRITSNYDELNEKTETLKLAFGIRSQGIEKQSSDPAAQAANLESADSRFNHIYYVLAEQSRKGEAANKENSAAIRELSDQMRGMDLRIEKQMEGLYSMIQKQMAEQMDGLYLRIQEQMAAMENRSREQALNLFNLVTTLAGRVLRMEEKVDYLYREIQPLIPRPLFPPS